MSFWRKSINKAPNPSFMAAARSGGNAATPIREVDLLQSMTSNSAFRATPMPRDPYDDTAFGPRHGLPLQPIDPVRTDTDRPEPRITEYEVAVNLELGTYRHIPWQTLRQASYEVDLLRRCIEIRKSRITALDWAWTVSNSAVETAMVGKKNTSKDDVERELRQQMQDQIGRLTQFWERPWRGNQLSFRQWVSALLEEYLVLDAVAVYPRQTYGGDVTDLEIIDGSTIKCLLDWRGATPQPPYPAYQQILYGFPRGEFTATVTELEDGSQAVDKGFLADQLYYYRSVPRVSSPYGISPVEEALTAARLYMKRQGWMITEYDDGVLPLLFFVPPGAGEGQALGEVFTPLKRREWEMAMNDELGGNTAARSRGKVTPPGWDIVTPQNVSEKYTPEYDMYLIRMLAAHMGVTIPSLNLQDPGGLGSTGYHDGLADIEYRNATLPTIQSLEEIINTLSQKYLGAPRELCFKFTGLESEDEAAMDEIAQNRVQSGRMTLNEDRDRQGLPRYNFPEADMPALMGQRGVVYLEGSKGLAPAGELITPPMAPPSTGEQENAPQEDSKEPKKPKATKDIVADLVKSYTASSGSQSVEQRVHDQLEEDFPEKALAWLPQAKWEGPVAVPADHIDFSNEKSWAAHHETHKVEKFEKKLRKGKFKPVILIKTPGSSQYMIADGHHRSLAARNLNAPILAYVGTVSKDSGPWDVMHDSQKVNGDTGASKAVVADLQKSEIAAYRRWLKRTDQRKPYRSFNFEHLSMADAMAQGVIKFEDVGVLATFKASDPGPKDEGAETPPQDAQEWPGWDADLAAAQYWAPKIIAALVAIGAVKAIIASLRKALHFPQVSNPPTAAEVKRVEHWITNNGVTVQTIEDALAETLENIWTDGYYVGSVASGGVVSGAAETAKEVLDEWKAGDPEAAKLLLGQMGDGSGLAEMLRQDNVWIEEISETTMRELAKILARDVAEGLGYDQIAKDLTAYIADEERALTIAITETSRAVSKASHNRYKAAGVRQVAWSTSLDDRVCPVCDANEASSPVPIGTPFESGDFQPPAHPRCRCALIPMFI